MAFDFLVDSRPMLYGHGAAGVDSQVAAGIQGQASRAVELGLNGSRVGRCDHLIVFQRFAGPIEHHVDAPVDLVVADTLVACPTHGRMHLIDCRL